MPVPSSDPAIPAASDVALMEGSSDHDLLSTSRENIAGPSTSPAQRKLPPRGRPRNPAARLTTAEKADNLALWRFKCDICWHIASCKGDMTKHKKVHAEKSFFCKDYGYPCLKPRHFGRLDAVKRHVNCHLGNAWVEEMKSGRDIEKLRKIHEDWRQLEMGSSEDEPWTFPLNPTSPQDSNA
ncbi:unnamed protein product [Cyclocybe aegerita]|uniref:C2H2-type domain-containing protein n=1 Tax=Cyclocybe aegerita TaxID=1973307 RepID=A0A8S0XX57_CYCAE|nr:unnamed protein product [Cyclocybe aegerita]